MTKPFLQVENLSKVYMSKGKIVKKALTNVSLEIHRGEILGLLGVNGAGKTTLASILATLKPGTAGRVLYRGTSIYDQLISYRAVVGLCPQKPNVEKNLSLEELLIFSGRCYGLSIPDAKTRAEELMEEYDLTSYRLAQMGELSGGYRQRFLIARALVHRPKLVILDEPTVGLDPHIRRHLWEAVRSLRDQGVTVLLTTHYLDEAEVLSDRVCLIHSGQVRTIDTPSNLKKLHQKNTLEEVFLKFVDDPDASIFNSMVNHD